MKRIVSGILLAMATTFCHAEQIKFMLTSDPHMMATELFDKPYGEAFIEAMHHDLKVIEDSQKLFDDFIAKVIAEHPDILLIPGDESKDGERASHEHVAMKLREVREAGIKVYVIPGNHDIENPCSKIYRGTEAKDAPSVSDEEFIQIYREDGYSESVMTDPETNSYMVYPTQRLALICVNTVIPNQYKARYVHGRIHSSTLAWIERAAKKAQKQHRMVLCMMHHEIMEHHDQATYFIPTAMVNQEYVNQPEPERTKLMEEHQLPTIEAVRSELRRIGIQVVLTGHYHIQSIKTCETPYGTITDVTSGALSGFPSPYRYIDLDTDKKTMVIKSATLFGNNTTQWPEMDDTSAPGANLAKKEFDRLRFMVQDYIPRIGNHKTDMKVAYEYLARAIDTALCALAAGDEERHDPQTVIDECMKVFDDYVHHVTMYDVEEIDKLKAEKDGPYARMHDLIASIMYNYVGSRSNNTPDNQYIINLK